ncbi:MAG: protein kinase [Sandaracinaceae bacterium]|nr:protein kinase [Sandaracinaceae bacterium]
MGEAYRIERQIGSGGMGAVFSATDERTGSRVALKWVLPGERHARSRERLIREWHLARQVRHPNVVEIFDAGEERGSSYLVMELLEGDSLEAWVARGPFDPAFVVDLMMPVLRGAAAAHAAGIVHRDLKPQNIILRRSNGGVRPTLIDFGISRAAAAGVYGDRKLTQHGITVGTPLYMAPEQLVGTQESDPQSDVYALGVILFELLAGAAPYESPADAPALISEKIDRPALRLQALLPDVDPRLDGVLAKALERSPSRRWGSVAELAKELERFGSARFTADEPDYRGPSPLERPATTLRVRQQPKRGPRIGLWLGVALGAVCLLAAGLLFGAYLAAPDPRATETVITTPPSRPRPLAEDPPDEAEPMAQAAVPTPEAPDDAVPEDPEPPATGTSPSPAAPRPTRRRALPRAVPAAGRTARPQGRSGRLSVDDF